MLGWAPSFELQEGRLPLAGATKVGWRKLHVQVVEEHVEDLAKGLQRRTQGPNEEG